ncbi:MAG: CRISPR-associated protein [Candidatus Methanofastidiosum methylothiophilum]|uniref:CRISPR-associated protein n=1 Tax=Candidatus Methanofastidiosum methylothiophilum TaxID=1705564 RepID=A0A150IHN1_9EURY|nr:MAG: CRISPR-associated protein [Candidatus Methanofastidiosum methylthiophilus]KYC46657.1 MAG: CRISPR-associated protein [Candidatus Methanofastidiosum methylthiophilus]KYC49077.1 MAG: CRISPR-associated protein [Candidatus Methanofastidiosum methylthiophilus]
MDLLAFDIWGDYAHFKKRYATTSPLTHSIPSKPTVMGLIAAILGFNRDEYQSIFKEYDSKIALQILNPIKKTRLSLNLINTKSEYLISSPMMNYYKQHTILNFEFIKDPKYRIYFFTKNNELYEQLKELLINHKTVYTPYLGLSELICNFSYVNEYNFKKLNSQEFQHITSIVPINKSKIGRLIKKIEPEEDKKYSIESIPSFINAEREVEEYVEVIIEESGKLIKVIPETYWELNDGTKIIPI